jgi:hypothetical protein
MASATGGADGSIPDVQSIDQTPQAASMDQTTQEEAIDLSTQLHSRAVKLLKFIDLEQVSWSSVAGDMAVTVGYVKFPTKERMMVNMYRSTTRKTICLSYYVPEKGFLPLPSESWEGFQDASVEWIYPMEDVATNVSDISKAIQSFGALLLFYKSPESFDEWPLTDTEEKGIEVIKLRLSNAKNIKGKTVSVIKTKGAEVVKGKIPKGLEEELGDFEPIDTSRIAARMKLAALPLQLRHIHEGGTLFTRVREASQDLSIQMPEQLRILRRQIYLAYLTMPRLNPRNYTTQRIDFPVEDWVRFVDVTGLPVFFREYIVYRHIEAHLKELTVTIIYKEKSQYQEIHRLAELVVLKRQSLHIRAHIPLAKFHVSDWRTAAEWFQRPDFCREIVPGAAHMVTEINARIIPGTSSNTTANKLATSIINNDTSFGRADLLKDFFACAFSLGREVGLKEVITHVVEPRANLKYLRVNPRIFLFLTHYPDANT